MATIQVHQHGWREYTPTMAPSALVVRGEADMVNADFYLDFDGPASRFPLLAAFFERLASKKSPLSESTDVCADTEAIIREPAWIDLLDTEAIQNVTSDGWDLESMLDSILNGEYSLVSLSFDSGSGRLVYDPLTYPFGGTDSLKALVTTFGFEVAHDSFHDGYVEWANREIKSR